MRKITKLIFVFSSIFIIGCVDNRCGNEILKEWVSPDKKLVASLLKRNCGATTSNVQVILIRRVGKVAKNISLDDLVFLMSGSAAIDVAWSGVDSIIITRPNYRKDIFKEESYFLGISINYKS